MRTVALSGSLSFTSSTILKVARLATKPQTEPHAGVAIPTIRRGVIHGDSTQQGRGRFLPQPIMVPVSRFANSKKVVSYLGLDPSEESSAGRQRLGAIRP